MLSNLSKRGVELKWIGRSPNEGKKFAVLVPQYNEGKDPKFLSRIGYFKSLSQNFGDMLDVILIDDGSTDGSLARIASMLDSFPPSFYLASTRPNANKVGALSMTALHIRHELVVLSDFDTDLSGLPNLIDRAELLTGNNELMGCYFRMLPYEGSGSVFLFQQLEYSLQRSIYKFHRKELSVRVMPGAGSCYKRQVLISIYEQHSGLRSGEDREATLLGLKLGYKTFYMDNILALTRPPLSLKSLIKQRVRWNLGYLETFSKEKRYYCGQISKFSIVGMLTLYDMLSLAFILLLPVIVALFLAINPLGMIAFLVVTYAIYIIQSFRLISISPSESSEIREVLLMAILFYPVFKICVDYTAWVRAIIIFVRTGGHTGYWEKP